MLQISYFILPKQTDKGEESFVLFLIELLDDRVSYDFSWWFFIICAIIVEQSLDSQLPFRNEKCCRDCKLL